MVKASEYWNGNNAVIIRNVVSLGLKLNRSESELWDSWPETRVGTFSVVMIRPILEYLMNVRLEASCFPTLGSVRLGKGLQSRKLRESLIDQLHRRGGSIPY